MACLCVASLPPRFLIEDPSLFLQLRVIRAFKSTLEDLEERRSVHSLHSLHSMRSSRSHTGPRPLSDFTYIDEDPTNSSGQSAAKYPVKGVATESSQETEQSYRGTRTHSQNSSASPLLLTVTGPANAYNHHTTNTTNDNRSTSNYTPNQANHALQSSNNREITGNSLLLSSNNLPDHSKVVHETSI